MLMRLRRPRARREPVDLAGRPMAERRRVILKNEGGAVAGMFGWLICMHVRRELWMSFWGGGDFWNLLMVGGC